MLAAIRESLP